MSREIFFKAKTLSGKWVKGYFAVIGKRSVIIKETSETYYSDEMKKGNGNEILDIDPVTLCRYTGLTDKGDEKIWENDVVEAWSQGTKAIGKVVQRIDGLWILYPA